MRNLQHLYRPNDNLSYLNAMKALLQARVPICDQSLIDLSMGLSPSVKLYGGQLKAVPKAAMLGELPDFLYTLPKRGFPTPFSRWYRECPLRDYMEDMLLSNSAKQRGIFNPEYLKKIWNSHVSGRTDTLIDYARAQRLYSISAVELWFRTFVDSDPLKDRVPGLHVGINKNFNG